MNNDNNEDEYDEEEEESYGDEDDEMENQENANEGENDDQQIQQLVEQINANPYEFTLYQKLIELYRQQGNLEDLRQARERVHQLYCLPVDMWLDWLQDEEQLLGANDDPALLLQLYESALSDYYYYKVCRKYCKFVIAMYSQGRLDISIVRQVHEQILQVYGLDVNRSFKLWEPYLKIEKEIFDNLKSSNANEEEIGKQESRIRSIYRRRVIFPTSDMLMTWNEYKEWETDKDEFQKVQERYILAKDRIDMMVSFEEKFQQSYKQLEESIDIESMLNLLADELQEIAGDNFNYVMLYFERILSEYTLNKDLWMLYTNYADELCKKKEQKQKIYQKAIKNCPFNHEFWLGYLRELEKNEVDSETIQSTAIQSIEQGGEQVDIEFQYQIFKHLCEFYVRSFIVPPGVKPDLTNEVVLKKVQVIRSMYADVIDNLEKLNPDDANVLAYTERLNLSLAEVEAYKIQDKKRVQELMDDYVKINGHQLMSWANYIKIMRNFPDHEKTLRGLFKRGLQIIKDNKSTFADLWLEWEKKFGSIQTLDQCIRHIKKLNLYNQPQHQVEQPEARQPKKGTKEKKEERQKPQRRQQQDIEHIEDESKHEEGKIMENKRFKNSDRQQTSPQQHNVESPVGSTEHPVDKKPKRTLFFRNLSDDAEEEDIQAMFEKVLPDVKLLDIRVVRDEQGVKRGIGFVDVETQEMAERSLKLNNYHLKGKALKVDLSKPPSEKEKDDYTIYVNNLPFTCTEQKLREHFQDIGEIGEVRLIRTPQGKVKGFAYIEFKKKKLVKKAIEEKHKSRIEGRTIIVERSQTNKKENSIGQTAHINNLSFKVTEEELKEFFEKFGEVKMLHLVKDKEGNSKGFAFIEFVNEDSLNATVKEKQFMIKDRMAIIKKSTRQITQHLTDNQMKKRDAKRERKKIISDIIEETEKEDEKAHKVLTESKPQVEQKPQTEQKPQGGKMSNEEFKKMLFSGGSK